MQPIGMPAWKLTADSIWNSFRNSGRRHLLLTGTRGIGKTTLLRRLLPEGLPGITTWAEPGRCVRLAENGTGRETVIGTARNQGGPGMEPVREGLLGLGLDALSRCLVSDSPWVSVDEIGFLEAGCPEYLDALLALFARKQVAAVIRKQELPFLKALLAREDAFVIDLDAPFDRIGCVVMASGLGQRFGGNKLMADFHGEPMVARALAATDFLPHRVVVTRHGAVADLCREREIPVVLHSLPYRSDTVRLGLEALSGIDSCIFCPGDQPRLTADTVMSLALLSRACPGMILRPWADGQPGAPILFPSHFFGELMVLPQGKGGGYVAARHPDRVRFLPIQNRLELMDADTPQSLEYLRNPYPQKST